MNAAQAAELLGVDEFPNGWSFVEIDRRGELAGFLCIKGDEIHCYRKEAHRGHWLSRQVLERHVQPLIDKYGKATTTVRTENAQGHFFVQRLGFVRVGEEDGLTRYELKRLKHARL